MDKGLRRDRETIVYTTGRDPSLTENPYGVQVYIHYHVGSGPVPLVWSLPWVVGRPTPRRPLPEGTRVARLPGRTLTSTLSPRFSLLCFLVCG